VNEFRLDPAGNQVPWWDINFTPSDRGDVYKKAITIWFSGNRNFRDPFINFVLKQQIDICVLRASTMLEF